MIIKRIMAGKKSIIMSGAAYSFLMYEIGRNNQTQVCKEQKCAMRCELFIAHI